MKKIISSIVLLLFFFVQVQAQNWQTAKDVPLFKQKLNESNAKIQSMKSDFFQEKKLTFMAQKINSKGVMWYKKPDKLRLSYTQPNKYEMVILGSKVLFKNGDKISKVDANNNKLFKYINDLMMSSMKGEVLNNTDFSYQFKENAQSMLVEMKPLKPALATYITQIHLIFSKTDWQLNSMEMFEKGGDVTLIKFSNRLINSNFQDEVFKIQ